MSDVDGTLVGCACNTPAAVTPPPDAVSTASVCLVFDMKNPMLQPADEAGQIGQWYTRSLVANPVSAVVHEGVVHWLDDIGVVHYEVPGQWFDTPATEILTKYQFAQMSAAQLEGAKRLYRVLVDGEYRGECVQRVTTNIAEERRGEAVEWSDDVAMDDSSREEFDFNPDPARATTFDLVIEEVASGLMSEGWRLRSIAFDIGTTGKMRKLGGTQKIGD